MPTGGGSPVPDILWWKFTNGSGTTVTATVGPNGTTDGSWVAGKSGAGYAVQTNGTSQEIQSSSVVTYGTNIITICAWVYWDTNANTDNVLFESGGSFSTDSAFFIAQNTAGYPGEADVALHSTTGDSSATLIVSFTRPSAAVWNHWAVVIDNSTTAGSIKVYINGSLQSLTVRDNDKLAAATFTALTFNCLARNATSLFSAGRVDDVRIYGRELNSGEVSAVMNDPQ